MTPIEPLLALSEKAVPGPWKHGVVDEKWGLFHKRGGCIAQMGPYGYTVDGEFICALVNWFRANAETLSRPEAELPEVTDEMVGRAVEEIRKAKHTCWDRWTDYDAMRAALEAAYGQQCAATRRDEVVAWRYVSASGEKGTWYLVETHGVPVLLDGPTVQYAYAVSGGQK